jgi:hypothetical protein
MALDAGLDADQPGNQNPVRFAGQIHYMSMEKLYRQAGVVHTTFHTMIQYSTIGTGRQDHLMTQLFQECPPKGIIDIVEQRSGNPDFQSIPPDRISFVPDSLKKAIWNSIAHFSGI